MHIENHAQTFGQVVITSFQKISEFVPGSPDTDKPINANLPMVHDRLFHAIYVCAFNIECAYYVGVSLSMRFRMPVRVFCRNNIFQYVEWKCIYCITSVDTARKNR